MTPRPSRTTGITILAVLEILIGIVGLLAGLLMIGLFAGVSPLTLTSAAGSWVMAFRLVFGGVLLFFSMIWLATGVGFLQGRGWSWTLGMIFSILSLLGAIGALTIGLITGGVVGMLFWGLILYYLTRIHVKAFFGKGRTALKACVRSAIFNRTFGHSLADRIKHRLRATVGCSSAGDFSASFTRSINDYSSDWPWLVNSFFIESAQ